MPKTTSTNATSILKELNSVQKEAVEYTEGPCLILAGAGSGKTKVLTHKIAYLIGRRKAFPSQVVALTFTNKAAREMQERIAGLVKDEIASLRCGTFHSFFASLLRRDGERLGFTSNFSIYNEDDQRELIKSIIEEDKQTLDGYTPAVISSQISRLKNKLILPEDFADHAHSDLEFRVSKIYPIYQARLKKNNAMDFDDLLLKPIELFQSYSSVLQNYQQRWSYLLVDEYQDTNYPQYLLLQMLSAQHRNISVVGDDDQSIYRWRGAELKNILDFERDYPDCKIFRMEQNYRSTSVILQAANSLIVNNLSRMGKELWTTKDGGDRVTLLQCGTGEEEAYRVVEKIQEEFHTHKRNFSEFAILYRTNAQSRVLEDGLRNNGISYVIVGGLRFYDRKEVRDVLAYLKVLCNPLDEISLKRIINFPLRGIGDTTIDKIDSFCREQNISYIHGLQRVAEIDKISDKTREKVTAFYDMLAKYSSLNSTISSIEIATALVDELGILRQLKEENTLEAQNRAQNIRELLTTISQFFQENPTALLEDFMASVALITDIDRWDRKANAVSLMTLHAAKGLEFPVVFIAGLEEGLLPMSRNTSDDDIEEERRLLYVGATRAKEKLYLSTAKSRFRYDGFYNCLPSRFINEIKPELMTIEQTQINSYQSTHTLKVTRKAAVAPKTFTTPTPKSNTLSKGKLVRHPQFGKGVVRFVEGVGEDQKVTILFEELGEKKLVVKFAKLEIL
jgi:DNA helicase II / ATP-dependent DNA helicase PcrA